MVMSLDRTIPMMMTIVTLLMLTMSLIILLPLEPGCSSIAHSELYVLLRYLVIVGYHISSKKLANFWHPFAIFQQGSSSSVCYNIIWSRCARTRLDVL